MLHEVNAVSTSQSLDLDCSYFDFSNKFEIKTVQFECKGLDVLTATMVLTCGLKLQCSHNITVFKVSTSTILSHILPQYNLFTAYCKCNLKPWLLSSLNASNPNYVMSQHIYKHIQQQQKPSIILRSRIGYVDQWCHNFLLYNISLFGS